MPLGTSWEHLGEHMENNKIIKNLSSPKPKRKKRNWALLSAS
jgi:hypothetical protein